MNKNRNDADGFSRMEPDQIERIRKLEAENARLKGQVAVLTLDKLILGEVVEDNDQGGARK